MTKVKINFNSRKRKLASLEGTNVDLKNDLPKLFTAFYEAVKDFEAEIAFTPLEARARGLEASLLNSKVLHRIQQQFPFDWKFCKYKRFVLRIRGYNLLVKMLNSKNMPMNIMTKNSMAINTQLSLPLFEDFEVDDPILYFGYKKNKLGFVTDPKLVYIDEGKVNWTISESNVSTLIETTTIPIISQPLTAEVKLREELLKNRRIN